MKVILFMVSIFIILVSTANADSPTDQGAYSVSGSISYTRPNGGGGRMISATPSFMYFVSPNIAMGASLLYWEHKSVGDESETYGIGPVVRYYFGRDAIYPFASVQYIYTKNKYESNYAGMTYKNKGRGNDLSVGIGVDYFLSKNVALEPIVTYRFNYDSYNSSFSGTTNARGEDLFIGIGVNAFIF